MLKIIFLICILIVCVLLVIGILFLNLSPQFGAKNKNESYKGIHRSPNYINGKFKNIENTLVMTGFKISSLPKYIIKGDQFPDEPVPVEKLPSHYFDTNSTLQTRITWFGHSALLLEVEGKKIFLDPMLGNISGPSSLIGPKRFNPELPMDAKDLPELDAVIISHDHPDHLDYKTILKIKDKVNRFYVPLGVGSHLIYWGVEKNKITELDWWSEIDLDGITIVSTPARHFSGRGLFDNNSSLWSSWVITGEKVNIFFSGDSGYAQIFKEIGEKYGPFDLTMLDCGQYDEQWSQVHMMPEEAVQANIDLKGRLFLPIHWGAFRLSIHKWSDPVERSVKKASEMNVKIITPKIGESIILGKFEPSSRWWESANTSNNK